MPIDNNNDNPTADVPAVDAQADERIRAVFQRAWRARETAARRTTAEIYAEQREARARYGIRNDTGCRRCGCYFESHGCDLNGACTSCYECHRFITREQAPYMVFFDFYRWAKKWIKLHPRNTAEKLRQIKSALSAPGYYIYCGGCKNPTFLNAANSRTIVKRQDGLSCSTCKKCPTCCQCVICNHCRKRVQPNSICPNCNMCGGSNCCHCKTCLSCRSQCGDDNCNICGYCNTCCRCSDECRVPFYTSYNRKPKFYKPSLKQRNLNRTSRYIAAEIEVAGIGGHGRPIYNAVKKWGGAVVYDGSLLAGGFEINTAPAGGDYFVQQVRDYCQEIVAQGGFVTNRCGLHIHVDARDLSYYDLRRLVRVYAAIEPALFAMVPPERSKSRYCRPCGQSYVSAIEEGRLPYEKVRSDVIVSVYNKESTQDLRTGKGYNVPSRYNALNLHSWFYRGTIECRMYDGSIDPDTISKWGIFWAMLMDYVVKNNDEEVARVMTKNNFANILKVVDGHQNMIDFLRARVIYFGNPVVVKQMQDYDKNLKVKENQ